MSSTRFERVAVGEAFTLYEGLASGQPVTLPPARPFGDYLAWLEEQDLRAIERLTADGVNVNAIHPGATDTERFGELLDMRSRASGKSIDKLRAEAQSKDGIRRIGTPEDVAALTLFLCSEKARHIQGTAIAVDGGATAGYY